MRFATWSTLINTSIIFTVALLSLIQAANAFEFVDLFITSPNGADPPYLPGDKILIEWFLYNNTELNNTDLTAFLRNDDIDYLYNYQQVTSLTTVYDNKTAHITTDEDYVYFMHNVTLPVEDIPPGRTYYIQFRTSFGTFNGGYFVIG